MWVSRKRGARNPFRVMSEKCRTLRTLRGTLSWCGLYSFCKIDGTQTLPREPPWNSSTSCSPASPVATSFHKSCCATWQTWESQAHDTTKRALRFMSTPAGGDRCSVGRTQRTLADRHVPALFSVLKLQLERPFAVRQCSVVERVRLYWDRQYRNRSD